MGGAAVEARLVERNEVQGQRPAPLEEKWARDEALPQVERGEVAVQRRSGERGEDVGREESPVRLVSERATAGLPCRMAARVVVEVLRFLLPNRRR